MKTKTGVRKEIQLAYIAIHDFFDNHGLETAEKEIEGILKSSLENAVWDKDMPGNLLYCMEQLQVLSSAAFVIHYNNDLREEAILMDSLSDPDILPVQGFVNRYAHSTPWNNFPRNLTASQYHNPYRAIKKFCKFMTEPQWMQVFADLTEYALCTDSIETTDSPYNILTLRKRLLQLIEACHLIEVRTNRENNKANEKKKLIKQ